MPMLIVDNVSRRVFDGVAAVHLRGQRVAVVAGDGRVIVPGAEAGPPATTPPVLGPIPAMATDVGRYFSFTATVSNAEGPLVWTWQGLPAGIAAAGSTIGGTPERAGTYPITVTVTDAGGLGASASGVLTVAAAVVAVAPVVTAPPAIAGSLTPGSTLTLAPGSASGTPAPVAAIQWRCAGADIAGATGLSHVIGNAETGKPITVRVTWSNTAGSVQAVTAAVTPQAGAAVNYDDGALIYYEKGMAVQGSNAAVTGVAMRGTAGMTLAAVGNGAEITSSAAGLSFAAGKSLSRTGLSGLPTGDGLFAVVRVTLNAAPATGTQDILAGSGKYPRILSLAPGAALTVQAVGDNNVNAALGNLTYPASFVVGGEMDDVANTLRALALDGRISTTAIALTDPSPSAFSVMKNVNGTLERLAIVARPEGGAWPLAFETVIADFRAA